MPDTAFDKIYTEYGIKVRQIIGKFIADKSTVDDIAQEVFLRVDTLLKRGWTPKDQVQLDATMIKITKGFITNHLKLKCVQTGVGATNCEELETLPWDSDRNTTVERVQAACQQLKPNYRDVVVARLAGKSHAEIGRELSISAHCSELRYARAQVMLKELLQQPAVVV